jgi:hypothetical protein
MSDDQDVPWPLLQIAREVRSVRRVNLGGGQSIVAAAADVNVDQERYFDDLRRIGTAFQVDARGNCNLVGICKDTRGWRVRGPGCAGLPSLTGHADRLNLYLLKHVSGPWWTKWTSSACWATRPSADGCACPCPPGGRW